MATIGQLIIQGVSQRLAFGVGDGGERVLGGRGESIGDDGVAAIFLQHELAQIVDGVVAKVLFMKIGQLGVSGRVHIQQPEHRAVVFFEGFDVVHRDLFRPDGGAVLDDGAHFDIDRGISFDDVLVEIHHSPASPDDELQAGVLVRGKKGAAGLVVVDRGLHDHRTVGGLQRH